MTTETTMPDTAATTTEGAAASSQPAGQETATGAVEGSQEQQATETQGQQQKQEPAAEQKPVGAPEKYEFAPPEGKEFSPEVLGAFSDVARELNLSQEQAQAAIDKLAPAFAAREAAAMESAKQTWASDASSDKEFGGDQFAENLSVAKKAVDAFASPELRALLEETGLGNHPEVIRVFYRAGKAISEDRVVTGSGHEGKATVAQRMYPNMNP